ncbi:MAG: hypothetical protein CM1200mP41_24790 [Gammaproteobacteria bacterium]|nr:MAG: hypothetical protein CM1200mP41_24790 [Gammaproteobacteria bacterium]
MATHSTLNRLPHDLRNQRGFTLIELMISLVIGLLLSAAIVKIYADTSQIYRFQGAVSEVKKTGVLPGLPASHRSPSGKFRL